MDEYIKREDALKAIAYVGFEKPTDIVPLTLRVAQKKIAKIPTADVVPKSEDTVEVVRCKDCVYFKQSVSPLFPHANAFICDFPYGLQKNVSENDFCCHGEKAAQQVVDANSAIPTPDPAASLKSEVEKWYHEYHAIKDELKQEKMYHSETEKLADRYCAELQTAKTEVERLDKIIAAKSVEYDQALQDKARECNIAIDKIRLEHRAKLALLHSSHEQELAKAKREVAWEIFAELDTMDIRIVRLRDALSYIDLVKKHKYKEGE